MMSLDAIYPCSDDGIVSLEPIIVRRTVRWGECDPAGIVYTPRFLDYCIEVYEAFLSLMLGGPLHSAKQPLGIDFPCRGAELDFRSPLPLDARFDMELRVAPPRSRTFDLHITGRRLDPEGPLIAFLARVSPIIVDVRERTAVSLPDPLRRAVEDYASRFPVMSED